MFNDGFTDNFIAFTKNKLTEDGEDLDDVEFFPSHSLISLIIRFGMHDDPLLTKEIHSLWMLKEAWEEREVAFARGEAAEEAEKYRAKYEHEPDDWGGLLFDIDTPANYT